MMDNVITGKIIGLAIGVHRALGPGLLESAYKNCFHYKILESGLYVQKEVCINFPFENIIIESGYRIDLLVENKLVLELKSIESLHSLLFAQTLTYMRLGNFKLGLLINFNVFRLKDGIKRIID